MQNFKEHFFGSELFDKIVPLTRNEDEEEITEFFKNYPLTVNMNLRKELDQMWIDNKDHLILFPEKTVLMFNYYFLSSTN